MNETAMSMAGHAEKEEGTFPGHIIPGTFLLLLGFWWTCSVIVSFVVRQKAHKPFQARCWHPWPYWPTIHLESYCKICCCLIGISIELLWRDHGSGTPRPLFDKAGHFKDGALNNYQHAAMYLAFVISGAADFVEHYYKRVPRGLAQVFLALSFLVETLLMGFHLKGPDLDKTAHLLLVYSMAATCVGALMELWQPRSFYVALLRPAAMMLQGTWFIQLAYVLYTNSPAWDQHRHAGVMFLPVVYCYHLTAIAIGMLIVYMVADWWVFRHGPTVGFALTEYSDDTEEEIDLILKEPSPTSRGMVQLSNKRTNSDRTPFDI